MLIISGECVNQKNPHVLFSRALQGRFNINLWAGVLDGMFSIEISLHVS
jgi:hypothetical protein